MIQEIQGDYGSSELGSICARLTVDQLRFVTARFNCSTDKDAAREIGVSPDTVTYWKRSGAPIDEAVKLLAFDGIIMAREILRRSVAEAAAIKRAGLQSKNEKIRQDASTEIMDRELGKPTQRVESKGEVKNELIVSYVNDWRENQATQSAPGPDSGQD